MRWSMVVASSSAVDHMRCYPSLIVQHLETCLVTLAAFEEQEWFVVDLLSPIGSLAGVADRVAYSLQLATSHKLNCDFKGVDLRATFRHPWRLGSPYLLL